MFDRMKKPAQSGLFLRRNRSDRLSGWAGDWRIPEGDHGIPSRNCASLNQSDHTFHEVPTGLSTRTQEIGVGKVVD